jgi:nitroreductase
MDVFEAITTNFAVRNFRTETIEDDKLGVILEAARLSQSAKNLQPWRFVVIKEKRMMRNLAGLMKGDVDEAIMNQAPIAVGLVGDPSSEFWLFDLGRAAQSMTLAAWELGIGSCVISGPEPPYREDFRKKAGRLLGIPEGLRFQEALVFGYPRKVVRKNRTKNRKTLEDLIIPTQG